MTFIKEKINANVHRVAAVIGAFALVLTPLTTSAAILDTVTYDADTSLELTGVPVTLTILSGSSHGDGLVVNASNFVLPASIIGTFTVRYTGPSAKKFTDGTTTYCTESSGNNEFAFTSTHVGKTISIDAADCLPAGGGGGGGGGGGVSSVPTLSITSPNGGESLAPGSVHLIQWTSSGGSQIKATITLSTDGGSTYGTTIVTDDPNDGMYNWTVPDIGTTSARLRIATESAYDIAQTSDVSNSDFTITGTPPPTTEEPVPELISEGEGQTTAELEAAAPATDSTSSGSYSPSAATNATPTINVDMGLEEPEGDETPPCEGGTLIKGTTSSTVYYCGKDAKRYVFPNEHIFYTWFADFSSVTELSDSVLASIPLAGNVTYKPGVRMVKITSDPKTYAVSRGGLLRWVQTEAVAVALYGSDWNTKIDDVDPSFFFSYGFGDPITAEDAGL
ncbi:hypothetical protein ACFLZO_01205 [Patescibacteria group bacterium]